VKFWRWLVALTSARETGTTLAVFRMAVAGVVLFSLLSVALSDMVEFIWVGKDHGGVFPLAGFFAGGEFGPINNRSYVHVQAASLALFREREARR